MDKRQLLSTLWIFLMVNYIFCDIFSLYYSEFLKQLFTGEVGGIKFTEEFLLSFAMIMEIPMLMIVISRIVHYKWNRILNICAGLLMVFVQIGSLVTGENMLHYIFFSIMEVAILFFIIGIALKWQSELHYEDFKKKR